MRLRRPAPDGDLRFGLVAEWVHFTLIRIMMLLSYRTESFNVLGLVTSATEFGFSQLLFAVSRAELSDTLNPKSRAHRLEPSALQSGCPSATDLTAARARKSFSEATEP